MAYLGLADKASSFSEEKCSLVVMTVFRFLNTPKSTSFWRAVVFLFVSSIASATRESSESGFSSLKFDLEED